MTDAETYDDAYAAGGMARDTGVPWLAALAIADTVADREAFLDGWQDAVRVHAAEYRARIEKIGGASRIRGGA